MCWSTIPYSWQLGNVAHSQTQMQCWSFFLKQYLYLFMKLWCHFQLVTEATGPCICASHVLCAAEWTFSVRVLATQNIVPTGEAMMRFYPRFFSLTNGTPPVCLGLWQHNHLRRYGGSQGFSFESGSRSIGE